MEFNLVWCQVFFMYFEPEIAFWILFCVVIWTVYKIWTKKNCISKKEACTVRYDSHSSKCVLSLFVLKRNKCSLLFVSILSEDMLLCLASLDLCAWDICQIFHSTPTLDGCETYFFVLSLELDIITFHYVVQNLCSKGERRRKYDKKGSEW